jgi:hypothetical protein
MGGGSTGCSVLNWKRGSGGGARTAACTPRLGVGRPASRLVRLSNTNSCVCGSARERSTRQRQLQAGAHRVTGDALRSRHVGLRRAGAFAHERGELPLDAPAGDVGVHLRGGEGRGRRLRRLGEALPVRRRLLLAVALDELQLQRGRQRGERHHVHRFALPQRRQLDAKVVVVVVVVVSAALAAALALLRRELRVRGLLGRAERIVVARRSLGRLQCLGCVGGRTGRLRSAALGLLRCAGRVSRRGAAPSRAPRAPGAR